METSREGARQPHRFDPARADRLHDPERERWLPRERIAALLDLQPGATVVDFGAGSGAIAVPLALAHPDVAVYALDEQPEMLAKLRAFAGERPPSNLRPIGPAALPALAGRCDRVLAVNVLHELGDTALSELRGLLTAEGQALVIDWRGEGDRPVGPPADHVYTTDEARSRLESAGFTTKQIDAFPHHYAFVARLHESAEPRD